MAQVLKKLLGLVTGWKPYAVRCTEKGVDFIYASGKIKTIDWNDLREVIIRTTDKGPFIEDSFFVLVDSRKQYVLPTGFPGGAELLQRLQKLPGFDNNAVIKSMSCTENKTFFCWKRVSE